MGNGIPWWFSVKNLPASRRDTGLVPALGRSHMPWGNYAWAPQLLSLLSRAHEIKLLKHTCPRAHALQQEKSAKEKDPARSNYRKSEHSKQLEKVWAQQTERKFKNNIWEDIICKRYIIFKKGLEHPWILVICRVSWYQFPKGTEEWLYLFTFLG